MQSTCLVMKSQAGVGMPSCLPYSATAPLSVMISVWRLNISMSWAMEG